MSNFNNSFQDSSFSRTGLPPQYSKDKSFSIVQKTITSSRSTQQSPFDFEIHKA